MIGPTSLKQSTGLFSERYGSPQWEGLLQRGFPLGEAVTAGDWL